LLPVATDRYQAIQFYARGTPTKGERHSKIKVNDTELHHGDTGTAPCWRDLALFLYLGKIYE